MLSFRSPAKRLIFSAGDNRARDKTKTRFVTHLSPRDNGPGKNPKFSNYYIGNTCAKVGKVRTHNYKSPILRNFQTDNSYQNSRTLWVLKDVKFFFKLIRQNILPTPSPNLEGSPSLSHPISSTHQLDTKGHSFPAPKIPQFNTKIPSVQHKKLRVVLNLNWESYDYRSNHSVVSSVRKIEKSSD